MLIWTASLVLCTVFVNVIAQSKQVTASEPQHQQWRLDCIYWFIACLAVCAKRIVCSSSFAAAEMQQSTAFNSDMCKAVFLAVVQDGLKSSHHSGPSDSRSPPPTVKTQAYVVSTSITELCIASPPICIISALVPPRCHIKNRSFQDSSPAHDESMLTKLYGRIL